jgi:TonB family protein
MKTKYKLIVIIIFGFSTLCFSQGRTPDFAFKLGNTNYFMDLSKVSAKAKNDTVFYNLYRYGKPQRIAKEIKHIVNRNTGDTVKSGSYEVINNQIFFYQKEKNKATILRLYTQNAKGLLSVKTAVSTFVAPPTPAPIAPSITPDHTGYPSQVDIPAEFPGGINKARQFIADNLQYPEEAQEEEIEGTVRVKFVIEKNGALTNIEIVNKLGYGCDQEVIRVLKRMPKWTPAMLKGAPVRSQFTMPVSFRLQ